MKSKIFAMNVGKEGTRSSIFADEIILWLETPRKSIEIQLELKRKLHKRHMR